MSRTLLLVATIAVAGVAVSAAVWGFAAPAAVSAAAWLYLWLGRGSFWCADWRLPAPRRAVPDSPGVVAVVPARHEAAVIGLSVASLMSQAYRGSFLAVVVDDASRDDTASRAATAAAATPSRRCDVVAARQRPPGWSGKVWAMSEGLAYADAVTPDAEYVLFVDADIALDRDTLERLVARATGGGYDLVSLMVRLSTETIAERWLIPAFVFFFQMLYPFSWVADPARRTAAAAGGVMLVRLAALRRIGGMSAISGALIDDCALARALKANGPIWLGLTARTASLRGYGGFAGVWRMVVRSAFDQLGYSTWTLGLTLAALAIVFVVPPVAVVVGLAGGGPLSTLLGGLGWLVMARTYVPTLRLYRIGAPAAFALPGIAALYGAMTADSAWRHWRGRGGEWKSRHHRPGVGTVG